MQILQSDWLRCPPSNEQLDNQPELFMIMIKKIMIMIMIMIIIIIIMIM